MPLKNERIIEHPNADEELFTPNPHTLVCFSHLRWDFVYQRPQHLLSRFADKYKVYFFEEPLFDQETESTLSFKLREDKVWVVTPHLPHNCSPEGAISIQRKLLDKLFITEEISNQIFWYYTPMALKFTGHLQPAFTIYDCMDELSNFKFAPPELRQLESDLFKKADIVFTGGHSLYEAKKESHDNIFAFPSSIDKKHFEQARTIGTEPEDQQKIQHPRLGFYGVIDERFDIDLVAEMARLKPDWQFILLGPVVKIDPATLPKNKNIHFLGSKSYNELPAYLSKWDVALIPFLLNDSTRFISPTKTPEYLAAGVPVISTAIRDVVYPYGEEGFVEIAGNAQEFVSAADELIKINKQQWLPNVDHFLANQSWCQTYSAMQENIDNTILSKNNKY